MNNAIGSFQPNELPFKMRYKGNGFPNKIPQDNEMNDNEIFAPNRVPKRRTNELKKLIDDITRFPLNKLNNK